MNEQTDADRLAAIHDEQRSLMDRAYEEQCEQTATLHVIRDLLAVMAEPKGDPCPCGCRRDVEPAHTHDPGDCPDLTPCDLDPEPEPATVTLPRDVVERAGNALTVAGNAAIDIGRHPVAHSHWALADDLRAALDATNGSQP